MKRKTIYSTLLLLTACFLFSYDLPKGWIRAGSSPDKYDMGIDKGSGRKGKNAATIKSISERIKGFGTLMQTASSEKYRGKRVRMTGYMRSEDVDRWAGLWFRVDDKEKSDKSLAFDNMNDRAITGTTNWKKYEIVLDVPKEAGILAYGALLDGTGQIWFDDIDFEVVDKSVPTTDVMHKAPRNLKFDE